MRTLVYVTLFCIICFATALVDNRPPWMIQKATQRVGIEFNNAKSNIKFIKDGVTQLAPMLGLRRSSGITQMCTQLTMMEPSQLNAVMQQQADGKSVPVKCFTGPIAFFKNVMCSEACKASPLLSGVTRRRLLGGTDTDHDPNAACKDPCFQPLMSGMLKLMTTMADPACKDALGRRSLQTPGRLLLGGATMSAQEQQMMEVTLGMMCSTNANGQYCMKLFETMGSGTTPTSSSSSSGTTPSSSSNTGCSSPEAQHLKTTFANLGCCWGNIELLMSMEAGASGFTPGSHQDIATTKDMLAACGIQVQSEPCKSALTMAAVASTTKLSGITKSEFTKPAQHAFVGGVAKTAKVDRGQVAITTITSSRRGDLVVGTTVTLVGSSANDDQIAALQTNLADQTALDAAIKAEATKEGTNAFDAVSVTSSTSQKAYKSEGTVAIDVSASGPLAHVSVATLVFGLGLAFFKLH